MQPAMSTGMATTGVDAPGRHSGTVLLDGLAASILAAVAPGAILDRRADGRPRAEARAVSGAHQFRYLTLCTRTYGGWKRARRVPFDPADTAGPLPVRSGQSRSTAGVRFGMLITQVALVGNVGMPPGGSAATDDVGVSQLVRVNASSRRRICACPSAVR